MPKIFRGREQPEATKEPPTPQAKTPAKSPSAPFSGHKQGFIERLQAIKAEGKRELEQASSKKEKRTIKLKTNLKVSKEIAESAEQIPLIGSIVGGMAQKARFDQKTGAMLFFGVNEKGEIVPKDERGKEALESFLNGQKHHFKALVTLASVVGVGELTLAAKAAQAGKLAKVASFGLKAKKAYEVGEDINVAREAVGDLRRKEVGWQTAIKATPLFLRGVGRKFGAKNMPRAEEATKVAARIMRRLPPEKVEEAIRSADDEKSAQSLHKFAKVIPSETESPKTADLPLAA